jgi:hypothetical protein
MQVTDDPRFPYTFGVNQFGSLVQLTAPRTRRIQSSSPTVVALGVDQLRLVKKLSMPRYKRAKNALLRFNLSQRSGLNTDNVTRLLNLWVAYECIFKLPMHAKASEFKKVIRRRTGSTELAQWAEKFYYFRNEISHGLRRYTKSKYKSLLPRPSDFKYKHQSSPFRSYNHFTIGSQFFIDSVFQKYLGTKISKPKYLRMIQPNDVLLKEIRSLADQQRKFNQKYFDLFELLKENDESGRKTDFDVIVNFLLNELRAIDVRMTNFVRSLRNLKSRKPKDFYLALFQLRNLVATNVYQLTPLQLLGNPMLLRMTDFMKLKQIFKFFDRTAFLSRKLAK